MELALERTAVIGSKLWLILALPFHSGRLAAIWLRAQQAIYQQQQELRAETVRYARFLGELKRSEQQLGSVITQLQTNEARRQAIFGHRATVARLGQRFLADVDLDEQTSQHAA